MTRESEPVADTSASGHFPPPTGLPVGHAGGASYEGHAGSEPTEQFDHPGPEPFESTPAEPVSRTRRRWVWPAVAVVALFVGVGIGAVGGGANPTSTSEYLALEEDRDNLQDEFATAQSRADEAEAEITTAQDAAETAERHSEERSEEVDERMNELDEREAEVEAQESGMEERESAVGTAEDRAAETQISNGMWTVGVDIEPGTYRVAEAVSETCYWAILRSGTNGSDIVDNALADGGFPTVTLSEGQDFENSCGIWNQQ